MDARYSNSYKIPRTFYGGGGFGAGLTGAKVYSAFHSFGYSSAYGAGGDKGTGVAILVFRGSVSTSLTLRTHTVTTGFSGSKWVIEAVTSNVNHTV